MMQITVFGANGRVGRLVVTELLKRGYRVVGLVHRHSSLPAHPNLTIMSGNVANSEDVDRALTGSDAVISVVASWKTPTKDILSSGMRAIIPAMQSQGITRIVSLTGSDAEMAGDRLSIIHRLAHAALHIFARDVLFDGEEHIRLLSTSKLEWTVLRPPIMNDRGDPEAYRLANKRPLPWATINRTSVALAIVALIDDQSQSHQAPYLRRS